MFTHSRLFFCIIVCVFFFNTADGRVVQRQLSNQNHQFFIENRGQWTSEVKYLYQTNGLNAWITDSGVVFDYFQIIRENNARELDHRLSINRAEPAHIKGHIVKTSMQGANARANTIAEGQSDGFYNYFVGNDPAKWASFVNLHDEIKMQGVYPGIDIRYYFDTGQLRYDYLVAAGTNPSQIRFRLEGADEYEFNIEGELLIKTSLGEVRHGKLRAYQYANYGEQDVPCRFEPLPDGTIGVVVSNYDTKKPLIIDPLVYSTFIGGSGTESGNSIAVDNSGNAYIIGNTPSTNYPTTTGAYDVSQNGNADVFVTKLDASGSTLVYSTFIGGSGLDYGNAIAVDSNGNTYITGYTGSMNYPTTSGAYQQSIKGSAYDAFVTKLNANGSALVFSTYFGGSSTDNGVAIALENVFGNIFIAGETFSSDFPTTSEAFDKTYNGGDDIFVTKFNTSGTALDFSTYLGGKSYDVVHSMAADVNGYPCVVGETTSTDFPLQFAYIKNSTDGLYNDVFVAKLNHGGAGLMYSTYLGGSNHDYANSVAFDADRNVYITGVTYSSDFPTTLGAYSQTYHNYEAFVTKITYTGTSLNYSTFIGGSGTDIGSNILADASGNAYITGRTTSTDYPVTSDAYDQGYNGGDWDVFVSQLNNSGSTLSYSTFIGGSGVDNGKSIALDNSGNVYLTGSTTSTNYPTTSGAYDQSYNGNNSDVFVSKLSLSAPDISSTPFAGSYGSINIGNFSEITFMIRNEGNADLNVTATTLTGTYATEFSIQSGGGAFTLVPAATRDIIVRFNPVSAGYKVATLNISSNDPDENPFLIMLSGWGVAAPVLAVNPTLLDFGATTNSLTFQISNTGGLTLNWTIAETPDKPWITSVTPASGSDNATITVTVSRALLPGTSDTGTLAVTSNGGNQNVTVNIAKQAALPSHWNFTASTGNSATVVLPTAANPNIDGTLLQNNDYVGVFTPAGLCCGWSQWQGANLSLTGWGDDDQTTAVDGLKPNEELKYRVYRSGVAKEWITVKVAYSVGTGLYSTNAFMVLSKFDVSEQVCLALDFKKGWNIFSINFTPIDPNISAVMAPIVSKLVIVKNSSGKTFIPAYGINDVGNMQFDNGYQANVTEAVALNICGKAIEPTTPISLPAGWNIISYLPPVPINIATALSTITSKLVIAKNNEGKTYIPSFGINDIGNMLPGQGYQVYVSSAATLIYPASPLSKTANEHVEIEPEHFRFIASTGENATVVMPTMINPQFSDGRLLEQGDEIGVFTRANLCCGAMVWDGTNKAITLWGNNNQTPDVDGFRAGDTLHFRVWNKSANLESSARVAFQTGQPVVYQTNGFSVLTQLIAAFPTDSRANISLAIPDEFHLLQNYPNPFNPSTTIEFALPKAAFVTLKIYNLLGEEVATLISGKSLAGIYRFNWDASGLANGIYLYRLIAGEFVGTKKLILLR
ncbi:SBBP repeat-containing protein [candidate division KSB1 bacterium]|nr:SBBP repeat-containing protein [candidate division KSB1 bacterium]